MSRKIISSFSFKTYLLVVAGVIMVSTAFGQATILKETETRLQSPDKNYDFTFTRRPRRQVKSRCITR
jgi:hypothetical protein